MLSDQHRRYGHFESGTPLYAEPPPHLWPFHDCHFYHVMDLPDFGLTGGQWDLRGRVDDYFGWFLFAGQRVLEIGPGSGYLTCEMEKRGAEVVALEVPDDPGWDFVPYPADHMDNLCAGRREAMARLKSAFWLAHSAFRLKAKVHYGDAYNLRPELGTFDVAVLADVLLHTKCPHAILTECAKVTDTIIVTELCYRDLEERGPILRLAPTPQNQDWGTWWHFTTGFFQNYLSVIGFTEQTLTFHEQYMTSQQRWAEHFTLIARRPLAQRIERAVANAAGRNGSASN
jgi:SAM-dependent methyltransferase